MRGNAEGAPAGAPSALTAYQVRGFAEAPNAASAFGPLSRRKAPNPGTSDDGGNNCTHDDRSTPWAAASSCCNMIRSCRLHHDFCRSPRC